jgi:hypothetical protein
MAGQIDDITINYEEDGVQLVKEIDKAILSRGSWTTIVFRYQEWNKKDSAYGEDKFSLRRYKKKGEEYWQQSKFTISGAEQAKKIIETLQKWLA